MTQHAKEDEINILVIDDNPDNLRIIIHVLSSRGYKVRPAPNGRIGIEAATTQKPELILLDINMPDLDGYQVCQLLKAEESTQDIPVIFLSAMNKPSVVQRCFAAGAIDYVCKPFNFDELEPRLRAHAILRRENNQREAAWQKSLTGIKDSLESVSKKLDGNTIDGAKEEVAELLRKIEANEIPE